MAVPIGAWLTEDVCSPCLVVLLVTFRAPELGDAIGTPSQLESLLHLSACCALIRLNRSTCM